MAFSSLEIAALLRDEMNHAQQACDAEQAKRRSPLLQEDDDTAPKKFNQMESPYR